MLKSDACGCHVGQINAAENFMVLRNEIMNDVTKEEISFSPEKA